MHEHFSGFAHSINWHSIQGMFSPHGQGCKDSFMICHDSDQYILLLFYTITVSAALIFMYFLFRNGKCIAVCENN